MKLFRKRKKEPEPRYIAYTFDPLDILTAFKEAHPGKRWVYGGKETKLFKEFEELNRLNRATF